MNSSTIRHPFAIRAALLSVLITSTMALIPALAGAGAHQNSDNAPTVQATATPPQSTQVG